MKLRQGKECVTWIIESISVSDSEEIVVGEPEIAEDSPGTDWRLSKRVVTRQQEFTTNDFCRLFHAPVDNLMKSKYQFLMQVRIRGNLDIAALDCWTVSIAQFFIVASDNRH